MSVFKPPYELSVWDEKLDSTYKKIERREDTIAAQDMDCLGQASNIKFDTNLNGTHNLSFQIPDGYYDSETKEFIHNEFVDNLYNEKKVKLFYDDEWYEFYVKSISDEKHHNNYIKTYTCTDSFIEELSRNGYGIIFDEELYNNVEEVGTFTREILEDSVWEYRPEFNWGDFTEYSEEKLFKIPASLFNGLRGYKVNFDIKSDLEIRNIYTGESRSAEMGDDICSGKYFWDGKDNKLPFISDLNRVKVPNDGYIYVPYTELEFCYKSNEQGNYAATEEVCYYKDEAGNNLSYALTPPTTNPKALIQFMAFPKGAEIEVDESGLILNKNYTYVMTVDDWNQTINSPYYYKSQPSISNKTKTFQKINRKLTADELANGNRAAYYEGYLDKIGNIEVLKGKKISISDRTEPNITKEIDQYVTVYNNDAFDFKDLLITDENWSNFIPLKEMVICSKTETRQIVPQLARNLVQNSSNIKSTQGWEIQCPYDSITVASAKISFECIEESVTEGDITYNSVTDTYLHFEPVETTELVEDKHNTLINFGLAGSEYKISANKIYCLGIRTKDLNNAQIIIGEGGLYSQGEYYIDTVATVLTDVLGKQDEKYVLIQFDKDINNPYIAIQSSTPYDLYNLWFFEAYTKGKDQFTGDDLKYRYSGRELFRTKLTQHLRGYSISDIYTKEEIRNEIIFEDDVMPGDTFSYEHYFIQEAGVNELDLKDTFAVKKFFDVNGNELSGHEFPLSSAKFSEDELIVSTAYIDLNRCEYYHQSNESDKCDCGYGSNTVDKICLYQKYGYCPYRFTTEKHCRKIRTLKGEKSNRFNLTQELSKVFEMYPIYYTAHESNGCVVTREDGTMEKFIFYIKEKGVENKVGFRYEKNLSNISRTIKSDQIVTKLYVSDVDSEISRTGLCSIKTAEDNPSKDSFIIDFSYYTTKGLLDKTQTDADLYGVTEGDTGYLKKLGYLNTQYDELSNKIIALQGESFTELEANLEVNFNGIEAAQKQLNKYRKEMDKYKEKNIESEDNEVYKSYVDRFNEQMGIYCKLIKETFCDTNGTYTDINTGKENDSDYSQFFKEIPLKKMQEMDYIKKHTYKYGMLGQYNKEYEQIQNWKKQQNAYLKLINELSQDFYRKYEPYLKEGTWSDSNYISDNAYYFGAKEVAAEGAIPKVEYNIQVVDLHALPEHEDYIFNIADTTYVEDVGMFGINPVTGFPNRLKVMISGISRVLDSPKDDSIKVQNFTTQFEDLFQQVTASVQSLSFNENIYKRASNFTSNQNISESSLQGTLDNNNLQLLNTSEKNIELNKQGQFGSDINNHANKYRFNGQGMEFSNDGGQSWNCGVGPGGINADYINVGTLDAGRIRIVDNNYLYFLWTKNGIQAFRNPQSVDTNKSIFSDYASFNKYGLSLVENGIIRLRSGYSFNGKTPEASSETQLGDEIGFYLYDNKGHVIFKTETAASATEEIMTARLSLTGEMYVNSTLKTHTQTTYEYTDGVFVTDKHTYSLIEYIPPVDGIEVNPSTLEPIEHGQKYSEFLNTGAINSGKHYFKLDNTQDSYLICSIIQDGKELYNYKGNYVYHIYLNTKIQQVKKTAEDMNEEATENIMMTRFDDQAYQIERSYGDKTDDIYIYEKKSNDIKVAQPITKKKFKYYKIATNGYDLETFEEDLYIVQDGVGISGYKNEKVTKGEIKPIENAIGIFINNTTVTEDSQQTSEEEREYFKRLWMIAKKQDEGFHNILSVLDNGELYIGGTIIPQDSEGDKMEDLSLLDNYVKIEIDDDTLKLGSEGISLGGENLVDKIMNKIADIQKMVENSGLIAHSHSIPELGVTLNTNGLNMYNTNKVDTFPFHDDWFIEVQGTTSATGFIKIKELINALHTVEGTTGTTGSARGGGGGYGGAASGYMVEGY